MKMLFIGLILAVGCALLELSECQQSGKTYNVVCYLGSWANYRNGRGKFLIEDIDPFLCTHLVYGFAKLGNDNRIAAYDPYLDLRENWGLGAYERFNNLRKNNTELKTLLAIGGWNEGSTKYSKMAATSGSRKIFVDSCVEFLKKYGFNGLDLDWEYPANRGGAANDKQNFATLLKEIKQAFAAHNLLITAAVSAGKNTIDTAYNIPAISKYLDLINLMAYDFHGGWESVTGLNAPLYARQGESESEKTLNADYAVNYWIKKGAPAKKLVLGMGLYGRSFSLQQSQVNGIGAPTNGKGNGGPYTQEPGLLGYNEICEMLKSDWNVVFNDEHKAPYAYKGKQWVGFDNVKSIGMKVDYIKKKKLGGGMVWSIETDDFKNYCGGGRYPLLSTIAKELNGIQRPTRNEPTTTSATSSAISTTKTEISSPRKPRDESDESSTAATDSSSTTLAAEATSPSEDICTEEGYIRDPADCTKFYYCKQKETSGYYVYPYKCGPGTYYSQAIQGCAFPYDVPECN